MKKLLIPSFPEERIEELYKHIEDKRKQQEDSRKELQYFLEELDSKGIDVSSIKQVLAKIQFDYTEKGFNLSHGISRHEGYDSDFPEIRERYREFNRHIRGIRTAINNLNSVMSEALEESLTEDQSDEVIKKIKTNQSEIFTDYTRSLFYGMFKPLIEIDWKSKISLFDYVVNNREGINISEYFKPKPLNEGSHVWAGPIKDLDKILRPTLISKGKSAKTIAEILSLMFPHTFQDQKKAYLKVERTLRR